MGPWGDLIVERGWSHERPCTEHEEEKGCRRGRKSDRLWDASRSRYIVGLRWLAAPVIEMRSACWPRAVSERPSEGAPEVIDAT